VTVLFGGRIVEDADAAQFFEAPAHPYSAALLAASPRYDRPEESLLPVPPDVIDATWREISAADAEWAKAGRGTR
jgi:dipeptide transport system ATP-binding protein